MRASASPAGGMLEDVGRQGMSNSARKSCIRCKHVICTCRGSGGGDSKNGDRGSGGGVSNNGDHANNTADAGDASPRGGDGLLRRAEAAASTGARGQEEPEDSRTRAYGAHTRMGGIGGGDSGGEVGEGVENVTQVTEEAPARDTTNATTKV